MVFRLIKNIPGIVIIHNAEIYFSIRSLCFSVISGNLCNVVNIKGLYKLLYSILILFVNKVIRLNDSCNCFSTKVIRKDNKVFNNYVRHRIDNVKLISFPAYQNYFNPRLLFSVRLFKIMYCLFRAVYFFSDLK